MTPAMRSKNGIPRPMETTSIIHSEIPSTGGAPKPNDNDLQNNTRHHSTLRGKNTIAPHG
jgi:hypothetical protein